LIEFGLLVLEKILKKISVFFICFRLYRKGVPHFFVYSKECKVINILTQVQFTFRSIIPWQISASFPWKITTITSVSPLQIYFKKINRTELSAVHSSWRRNQNYVISKFMTYILHLLMQWICQNTLSMFITTVNNKLKFCIFSVKLLTFLPPNVSCLYIIFFFLNQENIDTTLWSWYRPFICTLNCFFNAQCLKISMFQRLYPDDLEGKLFNIGHL
jgi:hypothetical protein